MILAYKLSGNHIVHDILDNECVVLDMESGSYYSLLNVAGDVWGGLMRQRPVAAIVEQVCAAYDGDPAAMATAVQGFVDELVTARLIVPADPDPAAPPVEMEKGRPFLAPRLVGYYDLQELLLLDPIHDTAQGWPVGLTGPTDRVVEYFEYAHAIFSAIQPTFECWFEIAGRTLCVRGPGSEPVARLAALSHVSIPPQVRPDLTICLWDDQASPTPLHRPTWAPHLSCTTRGDLLLGFESALMRCAYNHHSNALSLLHLERRIGLYWTRQLDTQPEYEEAAPLRTLLAWLVEGPGLQLVHGAGIGTSRGGVLLSARGGSGKSTTTLGCLESALSIAGDDYCAVTLDGPTLHTVYSAARVPWETLSRLPRLSDIVAGGREKAVLLLHRDFPDRLIHHFPLRAIMIPVLGPSTGLRSAAPIDAMQAVGPTTVRQLPGAGPRTLKTLQALCEAVPTYFLDLGPDPYKAAELLERFLTQPRGKGIPWDVADICPIIPAISAIVPVYNGARYVAEALESILAQTRPADEILVVDDGSSDDTCRVVEGFGDRVRLLRREHAGVAATMNAAVDAATGSVLAFLDADDVWVAEKTARQLAHLAADVDLVFGHVQQFHSPELSDAERERFPCPTTPQSGKHAGCMLVRRTLFDRIGLFDATLHASQFIEWYSRATAAGLHEVVLPDVLMRRRIHGQNLTVRAATTAQSEYLRLAHALIRSRR